MSGVAHADLLGIGGRAAGGLASQIDARTVGGLGGYTGFDGRASAVTEAFGDVSTTGIEQTRTDVAGTVAGTAYGAVYTGQAVGNEVRSHSRAAVRRADRAAQRAAAEAAVATQTAAESSAAAASNVGVIASEASYIGADVATDEAHVGANGGARGDFAASSGEGLDTSFASQADAGADAEVNSGFRGAVYGESTVAGSANAN